MLIDTTPLPDDIPQVKEIGASSAPLLSASFFIGARCRDYNDDYMQCKTENPGRGEFECMKEGRRVTRCAQSVYVFGGFYFFPFLAHSFAIGGFIFASYQGLQVLHSRRYVPKLTCYGVNRLKDINTHCLSEFRKHWECLDNRNQQLWQCRPAEWKLNQCVFDNLVGCCPFLIHPRRCSHSTRSFLLTSDAPSQKLEKKIPDQPNNVTPVELRPKQIFADVRIGPGDGKPFVAGQQSDAKQ